MRKYTFQEGENGERYAIKTEEWEKFQSRKFLESKFKEANIPKKRWKYTFDTYQGVDAFNNIPKLKEYVNRFEDAKGVHLYLWSTLNSTQKSTLASILGMSLVEKGYKVRFVLMSKLISHLQNEQFKEESKQFLEDISDSDFLIIDDAFDLKKATLYKSGFQIPFLDTFLRERLEVECLNTCFTSNIPVEEIETIYNKSIYALIKRHVSLFECNDPINDFDPKDFWS